MSLQIVICKPKSKSVQTGSEVVQSLGGWRVAMRPREDPVSLEKFKSSRCIVHLLSWFLLQPQTHQLISRTVFRQKQLWATYWGTGCEGAGSYGRKWDTDKTRTFEWSGWVSKWVRKNLSTIKGNINIINPLIMVYVSVFICFPQAIITFNHKSGLNYLIRGSPLGQEWIIGANLDNSLRCM